MIRCGDLTLKFREFMHGINKVHIYLISFFIVIISIKFIFSLGFPSPWIFPDETVYAETARNILKGHLFSNLEYCQTYPPGYSIILSVAYLFSDDMEVVYRIMLLINCILTSAILFPSYFILREFCNKNFSILGSITISTLPSVTLYTFVLMSENLFIPLFVFSGWFLLKSYSNGGKPWDLLAGLSIFYLYLTRSIGIAMIVGLLISFLFYMLISSKEQNVSEILKDKYLLIVSFAAPAIFWTFYKSIFDQEISRYNTDRYFAILFGFFSDMDSFKIFLSLFLHELEFLILSSYFVVFFIACLIVIKIYEEFKSCFVLDWNIRNCSEIAMNLPLISLFIYIIISSVILVVITVAHMYPTLIFGRYIDPIVPFIFLLGIIGFNLIYNKRYNVNQSDFVKILLLYITFIVVFAFTFPHEYYKFPNMFSIFYIQYLKTVVPIIVFILIFSLISFVLVYFIISRKKYANHLFLFMIFISLLASIWTVQVIQNYSSYHDRWSPIGKYINEHSEGDTLVLMDRLEAWPNMWFCTIFWMNGHPTHYTIDNDITHMKHDNVKYIISSKLLPDQPIMCSMGYKLYDIDKTRKEQVREIPFVIDIGLNDDCVIGDFHGAENQRIRWTKDSSKILIPYHPDSGPMKLDIKTSGHRPGDNPAKVKWYINENKIGEDIKLSGDYIYSFVVQNNWLNEDYQILTIVSNTWKPSDYGSSDTRDLGVQVDWVKVDSALEYGKGWHGLEDWDGTSTRWIENDAILAIESDQNRTADLTFQAVSFIHPRTLEIYDSNDDLIARAIIPRSLNSVDMPISLKIGTNTLRLHIPEGCEIPYDVTEGKSSDIRCLSVAVQNMTLS